MDIPDEQRENLMQFDVPSSDSEDEFIFGRNADKQAEAEMLSEYTDEDSLHSSDDDRIGEDHRHAQHDPKRAARTQTVHDTIDAMETVKMQRILQEDIGAAADYSADEGQHGVPSWLQVVPLTAVALDASCLFIIPPRQTVRVMLYNLMHHWLFEVYLILLIVSNAVFQACWVRSGPDATRPPFATWVDVFYLVAYIIEFIMRIVAFGVVAHKGALFRDVWHWLDLGVIVLGGLNLADQEGFGNYTSIRLLRVIRSCALLKRPIGLKLFARTFLRSSRAVLHVVSILAVALLFFALLGTQLFAGSLRYRCATVGASGTVFVVPWELCSPEATYRGETDNILWGHACATGYECADSSSSPNYDKFHFDNVGHALLAVFQIATIQGWSSMLRMTSDTVNTVAFLFYACVIVVCTWFLPGLILGIFMERADKTRDEYIHAQISRYDDMCHEKRLEALRSTVVSTADQPTADALLVDSQDDRRSEHGIRGSRDRRQHEEGSIPRDRSIAISSRRLRLPSARQRSALGTENTNEEGEAEMQPKGSTTPEPTDWSEEMRLQLHLSLTRNREIAESSEAEKVERRSGSASRSRSRREGAASASSSIANAQHRSSSAALRLEATAKELSFLDPSKRKQRMDEQRSMSRQTAGSLAGSRGVTPDAPSQPGSVSNQRLGAQSAGTISKRNPPAPPAVNPMMAPKLGSDAELMPASRPVSAHVPNKRATSDGGFDALGGMMVGEDASAASYLGTATVGAHSAATMGRYNINHTAGDPEHRSTTPSDPVKTPLHAVDPIGDTMPAPPPPPPDGFELIDVPDPEGGNLNEAASCAQGVEMILCMVHMFTEGYPRIISRYLHDCRIAKSRGQTTIDLGFTSLHEAQLTEAMKQHKKGRLATTKEADRLSAHEAYELEERIKMSPYNMAVGIVENVEATWFNCLLVAVLAVNSAVLASYHYQQSDQLATAQWVIHFAANLFYLTEVLLRIAGLGVVIYSCSLMNLVDTCVVLLGFVELGLNQTNVITCFRLYRVMSFMKKVRYLRSLRKVSRVLWLCVSDLIFLTFFMMLYVLLVSLYGMNLFGGDFTTGTALQTEALFLDIGSNTTTFTTRGNFNTFPDAAYAAIQAFSRMRDDWLLLTWSAMHVNGDYTIIYFVLSAMVAVYVFQTLFVAVLAEGFEKDDAQDDAEDDDGSLSMRGGVRSKFFDFSLLPLLQRKTGGFARRAVAPDHVFQLHTDMRNRLKTAEHDLDRFLLDGGGSAHGFLQPQFPHDRHDSAGSDNSIATVLRLQANQPRSAPPMHEDIVLPSASGGVTTDVATTATNSTSSTHRVDMRLSSVGRRTPHLYASHGPLRVVGTNNSVSEPSLAMVVSNDDMASIEEHAERSPMAVHPTTAMGTHSGSLLSVQRTTRTAGALNLREGPRLRLAKRRTHNKWELDQCDDCGDVKLVPLKAPPHTVQRTVEDLHGAQCEASGVRMAKQQVLHTLLEYVRLQQELSILPTLHCMETLLGQAWSCGLMLSETVDDLCAIDPLTERRSWARFLAAIELQMWLLDLRLGQEQIGRSTQAYILAYRRSEVEEMDDTTPKSLFIFRRGNPVRSLALDVLSSNWFNHANMAVIFAATIVLAIVNVLEKESSTRNHPLAILDDIFSMWMLLEVAVKWVAHGVVHPYPTAYVYSIANIFDAFIACISMASWADETLGLRYLKAFRMLHVFVYLQGIALFKDVRILAVALHDASRGFMSVAVFAGLNYFVWGCFALHLFAGTTYVCTDANTTTYAACSGSYNKTLHQTFVTVTVVNGTATFATTTNSTLQTMTRVWYSIADGNRFFDRIDYSLLTMIEVSTGSWWMDILYGAVDSVGEGVSPIKDHRPYMGLFFVAFYFVSGFVVLSLVAALTVYSYVKAKALVDGLTGLTIEQQTWLRIQHFLLANFRPRVQLQPLPYSLSRALHALCVSRFFDILMSCIVVANVLTMSIVAYGFSERNDRMLQCEYAWVALFIAEVVVRLAAHGPKTLVNRDHLFDAVVVVLSILQLGLNSTAHHRIPFDVNVLRMLRAFRIQHAIRFIPQVKRLRIYSQTLSNSLSMFLTVTMVLCISVFVFAVVGMHAFGGMSLDAAAYLDNRYNNYNTFLNALLMTFRVVTFESWNKVMRDLLPQASCDSAAHPTCGTNWAPLYFIVLVLFVGIVVISLFTAVVVETYVTTLQMEASLQRLGDIYRFVDLWEVYDPEATMLIPTDALHAIFRKLRPPLGITYQWDRTEMTQLCSEYGIPDHGGQVHFFEVLIPLAKRTLAWRINTEGGSGASSWKATESSLKALPVVRHRKSVATAELHFAASFAGAAFRRKRVMREAHAMRRARWQAGRDFCDAHDLPYDGYAYHSIRLDKPFPECPSTPLILRHQQVETFKEMRLPEAVPSAPAVMYDDVSASAAGQKKPPLSRPTSALVRSVSPSSHADRQSPSVSHRKSIIPDQIRRHSRAQASPSAEASASDEYRMSAQYTSVIEEGANKMFGPAAAEAIHRHERRSERLIRKQRNSIAAASAAAGAAAAAGEGASESYQLPLGTEPADWKAHETERRIRRQSSAGSHGTNVR